MKLEIISPKEVEMLIHSNRHLIIDVREEDEYLEGHIEGSINIPYDEIEDRIAEINKNKFIILYCDRGAKSLMAAKELTKIGYYVRSMSGGLVNWRGKLVK